MWELWACAEHIAKHKGDSAETFVQMRIAALSKLEDAAGVAPRSGRRITGCARGRLGSRRMCSAHGILECVEGGIVTLTVIAKAATGFLFELIARLQEIATVPMIDVRAYVAWLGTDLD